MIAVDPRVFELARYFVSAEFVDGGRFQSYSPEQIDRSTQALAETLQRAAEDELEHIELCERPRTKEA